MDPIPEPSFAAKAHDDLLRQFRFVEPKQARPEQDKDGERDACEREACEKGWLVKI